ncbi:MAG: hypothetical protein JWQ07_3104 [Ramlibacter sp.]|nr:hypothetical protein [Ramlibacter sp.]
MEACEEFLGGYAFFEIGFIKRLDKFGLVGRGKANGFFVVTGQNRNNSSLRQGESLDHDFAIDNSTSS